MKNKLHIISVFSLIFLVSFSSFSSNKNIPPLDTSHWKTHCFGRYLIDLPPNAEVSSRYEIESQEIKRLPNTIDELPALVQARENALKAMPHEKGGNMFVRRVDLANDSVALLSWRKEYSRNTLKMDTFLVSDKIGSLYLRSSLVSLDREQYGVDFATSLSENIFALEANEIPTGSGFCIDGADIVGNERRSESFMVGVKLPEHPNLLIKLTSMTQGKVSEENLIKRIDNSGIRTLNWFLGVKTLRKGRRDIGKIPAEEYLITGKEKGKTMYAFMWEAAGKASSVAEPNLTFGFHVSFNFYNESPPPPAFESNKQALQLWDAMLNSIRPRVGSVDAQPKVSNNVIQQSP